jgi:hypothetical protein
MRQAARELLKAFRTDQRGQVAIVMALTAVPLVASGGAAVDFVGANSVRTRLQEVADSAALAGAREYAVSPDEREDNVSVARKYIEANRGSNASGQVSASDADRTVTVTLKGIHETALLGVVGMETIAVGVSSTAKLATSKGPLRCLHALNPTKEGALKVTGSATLDALPCATWVNSNSSRALQVGNAAELTAKKNCVRGGASGKKNISPAIENCGTAGDPFAGRNPSTPAACSHNDFSTKSGTLTPGVYCGGIKITGNGTVTLSPGVYVIRDGTLDVSGNGALIGDGVTFVFEGDATADITGGKDIRLVAPKTGEFASFVFFQRSTAAPGKESRLTGNSGMYFEGIVYFPTQTLKVTGSGGTTATSPFSAYIADTLEVTGNGTLKVDYDPADTDLTIPDELYMQEPVLVLVK